MTQFEFNSKVAQAIHKEYECFETNVDPPDRACGTYQIIRASVIKDMEKKHGMKVNEAFLRREGL